MDLRAENRALRAENTWLKAERAALGIEGAPYQAWAAGLSSAEASLLAVLLQRHPRWVDQYSLEEASRTKDHVAERDVSIVKTLVHKIRKKLPGSIENVHGRGYRASDAFAANAKSGGGPSPVRANG